MFVLPVCKLPVIPQKLPVQSRKKEVGGHISTTFPLASGSFTFNGETSCNNAVGMFGTGVSQLTVKLLAIMC